MELTHVPSPFGRTPGLAPSILNFDCALSNFQLGLIDNNFEIFYLLPSTGHFPSLTRLSVFSRSLFMPASLSALSSSLNTLSPDSLVQFLLVLCLCFILFVCCFPPDSMSHPASPDLSGWGFSNSRSWIFFMLYLSLSLP